VVPVSPDNSWRRTVALYLTGQTLSLFGSAVVGYSVVWHIALETRSAVQFAVMTLVAVLPQGLVALPAGVWADRHSRKKLVIGADAAVAVVTAGLAVAFWFDVAGFVVIGLALLARSIGGGVHTPAETALLPQITPTRYLLRVNAINGAIQSACFLAAPALAAVLLTIWGMTWILLVDVVTAAVAIAILVRIPVPPPPGATAERRHVWREVATGIGAAMSRPVLKRTLWLGVVVNLVILPVGMLAPIVVIKLFGSEPWMLASVELAYSGAMIAGGAVLAAWGGLRNRMTLMLLASLLWGIFTIAQAASPNIWVYAALWAAFGLVGPWLSTTSITVVQEHSPPELLGRLMGLVSTVMMLAAPAGMMVVAPLMDLPQAPVRLVLAVTGFLGVLVTGLAAIKAPAALAPEAPNAEAGGHA
jgi:DHA3 family macrolide efflux protein-like MFS transporter